MDVLNYFKEGARYNLISDDENSGVDIIAAFIYWSVKNNRQCVYYSDNQTQEDLRDKLFYYGLDMEELIGKGSIVFGLWTDFFSEKRVYIRYFNIVQMIKDAQEKGFIGLSLMVNRYTFYEHGFTEEELYEYERALNKLFSQYSVSGINIYNIDKIGTDAFFETTRLNPNFIYQMDDQIFDYNNNQNPDSSEDTKKLVYAFLKRREKMKRENKVYQFISHLSGELSYKKDEKDIIETGLNSICKAAYAQYGFVVMIRDGEFDTDNLIKYNVPGDIMEMHLRNDFVERYHKSRLENNADYMVYSIDNMGENIKVVLEKYNIFSSIVIPIKYNNDIFGYMWLATKDKYISFNDTRTFLCKVCETIASMLNEHRHYKKMQDSLLQARKIQALGELAGGIAHEFNNILTPILGYLQLLKSKVEDPMLSRYVDLIEDSAKDGSRIVRRIQDFSKNRKKEKEIVDVDRVIIQSVEITKPKWTLESQIKNKFININLDLTSEAHVHGIATEMREIFVNLIANAVDAMPSGGNIYITSRNRDGEVVIRIRDSGVGMEKDTIDRIFEPFFTTKNERGNGLGLSIVYNIVREMGGTIECESSYGDGAEFTITLPLKSGNVRKKVVPELPIEKKNYRILVIDDQEPVASAVSEMMKSIGHEVEVSTEDIKAVDIFKEKDFDCVICDLAMPNYSGTQMSEMLKSIKPKIPFILMTGWPGKLKAKDLKCIDDIIQKPFSIEEINNVINKVIKKEAQK
jgi:nitrogen-specific signal transduction histidine kinase/CheY-like chemotaxis protein